MEHAADPSHPRYRSLLMRHRLEVEPKKGMLADSAMIAHGRGEAYDYLLGETTIPSADVATQVALNALMQAEHPVLSVNGNVVALAGDEMLKLADKIGCPLEVNIFYRTPERMEALLSDLNERKEGGSVLISLVPTQMQSFWTQRTSSKMRIKRNPTC